MAINAVRSPCILGAHRITAQGVFFRREHAQMVGINAVRLAANVIDHVGLRNVSNCIPVSNAMSAAILPPKPEGSVTVFIQRPQPQPTFLGFIDASIESLPFLFRHAFHEGHYIPCQT